MSLMKQSLCPLLRISLPLQGIHYFSPIPLFSYSYHHHGYQMSPLRLLLSSFLKVKFEQQN
jgi:hypothetical protein